MYDWIYWIIIIVLVFAVSQYRKQARVQKERTKMWKEAYVEANDAWAKQSNAIREKGIECAQWKKEFENLKRKLKKARITI